MRHSPWTGMILRVLLLVVALATGADARAVSTRAAALTPTLTLTMDQAIQLATEKDFDSLIEYEHRLQSKYLAKAARANLFPHLSATSLLAATPPSVLGLMAAVGNFAPFLLPSRWQQAGAAKNRYAFDDKAWSLVRLNLAIQVETLAYLLDRDVRIHSAYLEAIVGATGILSYLRDLEQGGRIAEGSSDHIVTVLNTLKLDSEAAALLVYQDRLAITQSLGLTVPLEGVTIALPTLSLELYADPDSAQLSALAVSRALELRQMDDLIEIARRQKKEVYFSWLDPAADSGAVLGGATRHNLAVARSRIREIELRKAQVEQSIVLRVHDAIASLVQARRSLGIATENFQLQAGRLRRIVAQAEGSPGFNALDVQSIIQDQVSAQVREATVEAMVHTTYARLNRLLMQGRYGDAYFTRSIEPR